MHTPSKHRGVLAEIFIMKIPVDINVKIERTDFSNYRNVADVPAPSTVENKYKGLMTVSKKLLRLEYDEGTGIGGESLKTVVSSFGDFVSISRSGGFNSSLFFEEGKACDCVCDAGFMPMNLRVYTKRLFNKLSPEGGNLELDYTVEIVGNLAEANSFKLSFAPANCGS